MISVEEQERRIRRARERFTRFSNHQLAAELMRMARFRRCRPETERSAILMEVAERLEAISE